MMKILTKNIKKNKMSQFGKKFKKDKLNMMNKKDSNNYQQKIWIINNNKKKQKQKIIKIQKILIFKINKKGFSHLISLKILKIITQIKVILVRTKVNCKNKLLKKIF